MLGAICLFINRHIRAKIKEYKSSMSINKNKLKALFNLSQSGMAILDLEANHLEFNPAYLSLTGFSRKELLTKNFIDLSSPESINQTKKAFHEIKKKNDVKTFVNTCLTKNGKSFEANVQLYFLPGNKEILVSTQDITENIRLHESIKWLSKHDPLTLLPNRNSLNRQLKNIIKNLHIDQTLYLVLFDLDAFKTVNDQYGHATGDKLLKKIAERFSQNLQPHEIVSRISGDEFVMLLIADNQENLLKRQQELLKVICQPYHLQPVDTPVKVSFSLGISQLSNATQELDTLLRQAEQAKRQEKSRVEIFSHEVSLFYKKQGQCIEHITQAIENDELVLHYQPKVNLLTGEIIGFEALIRWQSPDKGLIYPNDFIPFIESHEIIINLGEWVASEAIKQLSYWKS